MASSGPLWRGASARGIGRTCIPFWGRHTPTELTELIDRLLEARRPRAAFHAVHMDFKDIETSRLKRLLRDVATVNAEPAGPFQARPLLHFRGTEFA